MDGGGAYLAMTLGGTVVSICSPDTPSSGAAWISAGSVSDTKRMDVTVLFDTDKSQYTVFINGSLITKNRYARSGTSVTAISNFKIYMDQEQVNMRVLMITEYTEFFRLKKTDLIMTLTGSMSSFWEMRQYRVKLKTT